MYQKETFMGRSMIRQNYSQKPYYVTVQAGVTTRRGTHGTRTYTSNGYVYMIPTDYYRRVSWFPYCRTIGTEWSSTEMRYVTYVKYLGFSDSLPNASSIRTVYSDTYFGSNPTIAAKSKAYSNLQSNMVNYAMLTKDLRDGLKLAQDYFSRLSRAAPYIKRKKFKKAFSAFFGTSKKRKAAANTWLEFQWGVKPTIDAVQTAFKRAMADDARVIRIVGKGVSELNQIPQPNKSHRWSGHITQRAVCKVYRYFKNNYFVEQAAFNPVEPAFDAVPWSFLVNWFIPIEDYLRQFGYVSIWSETFGCDSLKAEWNYGVNWIEFGPAERPITHTVWWSPRVEMTFSRSEASAINLPLDFAEMLSRGSINMSIKRLLNTTALVTQRL